MQKRSSLAYASQEGDIETVKKLLATDPPSDITSQTEFEREGGTALYAAVHRGNIEIVKLLVQAAEDRKMDVPAYLSQALRGMVYSGSPSQLDIVEFLVAKGAQDLAIGSGNTMLHIAAAAGNNALCQMLLERRGNPNGPLTPTKLSYTENNVLGKQRINMSPLLAAVVNGKPECVQLLLDYRGDTNLLKPLSALHLAAFSGNSGTVEILAQVSAWFPVGVNPVIVARQRSTQC